MPQPARKANPPCKGKKCSAGPKIESLKTVQEDIEDKKAKNFRKEARSERPSEVAKRKEFRSERPSEASKTAVSKYSKRKNEDL